MAVSAAPCTARACLWEELVHSPADSAIQVRRKVDLRRRIQYWPGDEICTHSFCFLKAPLTLATKKMQTNSRRLTPDIDARLRRSNIDNLWPSPIEHARGSCSHKAILHEVVGARLAFHTPHKQRLAHRNVLCGSGLDLPGAAPHPPLYGTPGIQHTS